MFVESRYRLCFAISAILLIELCWCATPTAAQSSQSTGLDFRRAADSKFQKQLESLAAECEAQGKIDLAEQTRSWFIPRSAGRQFIFVTADRQPSGDQELPELPAAEKKWQERFQKIRDEQADRLWKLVDQSLVEGEATRAVQLIYEILRERPGDKRATKALGIKRRSRKSKSGSSGATSRPTLARNAHPALGWPARKYWRLQTCLLYTSPSPRDS